MKLLVNFVNFVFVIIDIRDNFQGKRLKYLTSAAAHQDKQPEVLWLIFGLEVSYLSILCLCFYSLTLDVNFQRLNVKVLEFCSGALI